MRARVALVTLALVLTAQYYFGDQPTYWSLVADGTAFGSISWWAASKLLGYFVVPLGVLFATGGRLSDCGVGIGKTREHAWIYLALYAAVLPLVYFASRSEAFVQTYPFYRGVHQLSWELLYGATFVTLEFLFRGYLLFALEAEIGSLAIFVMMVPYVMIHFGKPLPEVLGAVVAGGVLGWMALRTRSIWGGVCVHVAVAWTMDGLALAR